MNTARSAFACFLFERKFFISYRDAQNGCGTDSQEEGRFKCKIPTRVSLSQVVSQFSDESDCQYNIAVGGMVVLILTPSVATYNQWFLLTLVYFKIMIIL